MQRPPSLPGSSAGLVLIVDDVPENLSLLYDALNEAGYTVLVATHGEAALKRARQSLPDVILLDALMPGMDGFQVSQALKEDARTRPIPVIFMTGLTDTEHVVAAYEVGGTDYVTKPIRPPEVLARIAAHVRNARMSQQAQRALDAFGQITITLHLTQRRVEAQTERGRELLETYLGCVDGQASARVMEWVADARRALELGTPAPALHALRGERKLIVTVLDTRRADEWLAVLREETDEADLETMRAALNLTLREAEVLYWVVRGKTSKDIGDILGSSPRTVDKHLQHVFEKLGVETRTAAAAVALERIRSVVRAGNR